MSDSGEPSSSSEAVGHEPSSSSEAVGHELVYSLYQQGRQRLDGGDPGGAAEVLELAVAHEPTKASLHETLGRAYFASSRVAAARAEFEQALRIDPSDAYAHFGVGRCFERENRLPQAAKHLKLACALADNADYRAALDRVLGRLNRSQAAG
ncbi:MAG: tetratricopeptide repeat protein [Actinomycetota bacterium]|nr:tetratricopeptide repeat protein [Actinomycetota bacterium]